MVEAQWACEEEGGTLLRPTSVEQWNAALRIVEVFLEVRDWTHLCGAVERYTPNSEGKE